MGDASADVRHAAFEAIGQAAVAHDEVDRLVDLLGRKPGDPGAGRSAGSGCSATASCCARRTG